MTAPAGGPASGLMPGADGPAWHTLSTDRVLQEEKVDDHVGLSSAEAASRAQRFGPNKFDTGKAEPRWRAFIRQFADPMQIVLLVAGVVSLLFAGVGDRHRPNTQNHPGKGDDTPEPLAQNLGTGSKRAGPDSGHASLPAA